MAEAVAAPRCWVCGAEPDMLDDTAMGDPGPVLIPGRWPEPAVGHEHALEPPTPAELLAESDRIRERMVNGW